MPDEKRALSVSRDEWNTAIDADVPSFDLRFGVTARELGRAAGDQYRAAVREAEHLDKSRK